MNLNRHGKLVRWAYFFKDKWHVPTQTSLCAFFWRAFVWIPLVWAVLVGVAFVITVTLLRATWLHPRNAAIIVGMIVVIYLFFAWSEDGFTIPQPLEDIFDEIVYTVSESTFWQGLVAIKGKFCPIIKIVDETDDKAAGCYVDEDWPDFEDLG